MGRNKNLNLIFWLHKTAFTVFSQWKLMATSVHTDQYKNGLFLTNTTYIQLALEFTSVQYTPTHW